VFIDYLTLMLVNMAAGLIVLAFFLWRGLGSPGEKSWAAGFAVAGLGGPLVLAVVLATGQRWLRALAAVVLVSVAGLWLFTAARAYWGHLAMLSQ